MDATTDKTHGNSHSFHGRVEDEPLVRGHGRYVADAPMPNQAFAFFVRSPHAFAKILSIDPSGAVNTPGVVAVLTAKDMEGVGNIARHPPVPGRDGGKLIITHRPALAGERVMHLGEAVAVVVADSAQVAQDAAEFVHVEYEELTPVVDARDALRDGATQIWPDVPGNLAVDWPGPQADPAANAAEVERLFASAKYVARMAEMNQRLVVASMEPRGATASYDATSDSYLLRTCSQGAGAMRDNVLTIMNWTKEKLRVITEDVGGAFGLKTSAYPEYLALLVAAKKTGRPVHWMSGRSEAFLTDNQGRDIYSEAELALDEKGKFLALRIRNTANLGAYVGAVGANIPTFNFTRCLPGMYDIKHIDVATRCAYTNTTPTAPYRGAGRPEANYVLERLVDEASRLSGIDPAKLRRRNLIKKSQMPYKTAVGTTFDSGDFEPILDKALELASYDTFKQRKREAAKRGKYRGLGISCMLEHAGGAPIESAQLSFPGGNKLLLTLNVQNTGQGHATVFPQVIAERLGIPFANIGHSHGDSSHELAGYASVGSRSAMTAGHSIVKAIESIVEKGKPIAATMLETGESDIAYKDGSFEVVGTDRRVSLFDVAARAADMKKRGEIAEDLDTRTKTETPLSFPNGCHIAEIEIDPDTGHLAVVAYAAVDDCGRALSHTIVEGQLHGSLMQGLGQALMENTVYDRDSGQLVTGSFMDYAMPRAEDSPPLRDAMHNVPATTNPLGVKGVGEAGTTAGIAAVMNAVADAIPNGAGAHLEMPVSPPRVWEACQRAKG
ncbi:MAG TPA: xanthine dehydrogenase family protein molybdopterin-binding subunit [Xanthobacteraceae bacterium]|jgi:carbon-monoxide dehydrogenase large subunit|nr:xanthine dehydrogenase family protein molybdopterin-binding subunit [Xanthobacteraceae bacterium]